MTRYATTTDLTRLGLPSGALTNVPTATQEEALDAASATMDGYLAQLFTLPLSAWREDITRCCAVLAGWDLMVTRGFQPGAGNDETLRLRYEDAQRLLRDWSARRATPQGVTDATPTDTSEQDGTFVITNTRRRWRR
jgi:phage gp36-like protein